jgi:hypothetical protein
MSLKSGDEIRPPLPESGQPDSGDQSDRNPAIWPENQIPAGWPDRAREAGSQPTLAREAGSRPLSPEFGYPRFRQNCPDSGLYLEFWQY